MVIKDLRFFFSFFLLLVDSVIFVVDDALFGAFVCGKQCYTYIRIVFF